MKIKNALIEYHLIFAYCSRKDDENVSYVLYMLYSKLLNNYRNPCIGINTYILNARKCLFSKKIS